MTHLSRRDFLTTTSAVAGAAMLSMPSIVAPQTAPGGCWATAEVGGGDQKRLQQVAQQMDKVLSG